MKRGVLILIQAYQSFVSPIVVALLGHGCKFRPTCSEYAKLAITRFGIFKGSVFAVKRIARCHPFTHPDSFFDPVPARR